MSAELSSVRATALRIRRGRKWGGGGQPKSRLAAEIETRLLSLLVEQNLAAMRATASVIVMTLLISPFLARTVWIVWILLARAVALGFFQLFAASLSDDLVRSRATARSINRMVAINGIAAFLWGALTWPLEIGTGLDFMSFLVITIALFSVCLSVVSAGLHRPTLLATALGGMLGLAPKIAALTPQIGILLPLGFAIYAVTIVAYALVISRQALAGVLTQIRSQRYSERLTRANDALREALGRASWLASRDTLTELRNRRAFEQDLLDFAVRFAHRQLCLLLLDIDHFKRINDRFGHETGDGVLVAVGTALRQWERTATGRMTGRWGGEEFIAVVALRADQSAQASAEDLRKRIEALGDQLHWPADVTLTTSIGCAELAAPEDFDMALFLADGALYTAKNSGRNCWQMAA